MKYIHTETGEEWLDRNPSTKNTSNFYLLSHQEKMDLGWELVDGSSVSEVILPKEITLDQLKHGRKQLLKGNFMLEILEDSSKAMGLVDKYNNLCNDIDLSTSEEELNLITW